jgi:hypothetical protein
MAVSHPELLNFHGIPPLLSLNEPVTGTWLQRGSYRFELAGGQAILSVRPMAGSTSKYSLVRLKIPKSTPPGTYQSRCALEDHEVPVVVAVEPSHDLRFVPESLSAAAAPGETIQTAVTIVNTGNADLPLAGEDTFCVFDSSGVDRAFCTALTQDANGGQRLERLFDELSGLHGGLVRVRLKEGATAIPPGEAKRIELIFDCSRRLRPGRTYTGAWSLLKFSCSVQLVVIKSRKEGSQ